MRSLCCPAGALAWGLSSAALSCLCCAPSMFIQASIYGLMQPGSDAHLDMDAAVEFWCCLQV